MQFQKKMRFKINDSLTEIYCNFCQKSSQILIMHDFRTILVKNLIL